jgi:hypothetical protein
MKNTKQRFQDKANQMIEEHGGGGDFAKFMKEEVKKAVEETTPAERGEEAANKDERILQILDLYWEIVEGAEEVIAMMEDEPERMRNAYTLEELEELAYDVEQAKYTVGDQNIGITDRIIDADK